MFNLKTTKELEKIEKIEKPLVYTLAPKYGTTENYLFYQNFGHLAYYPYTKLNCGCIYVEQPYEEKSVYSYKFTYIAVCTRHLINSQIEDHRSIYKTIREGE